MNPVFEYRIISFPSNTGIMAIQNALDQIGPEGWELAGILGLIFIFKRQKQMVTQ